MSMYPPLFSTIRNVAAVKAVLGNSVRMYPHGEAPAEDSPLFAKPYAVHQMINGNPENYLAGLPDADGFTTQIDIYGDTPASVAAVAQAIRDAVEPVAYVERYAQNGRDPDTNLFRYSMDVDWIVDR